MNFHNTKDSDKCENPPIRKFKILSNNIIRTLIYGIGGVIFLYGSCYVITPIIVKIAQPKEIVSVKMFSQQEMVSGHIKQCEAISMYTIDTLSYITNKFLEKDFSEKVKMSLLKKKRKLINYDEMIAIDDELLSKLTQLTHSKLSITITIIDSIINSFDNPNNLDIVALNKNISEYNKLSTNNKSVLIELITKSGMTYEIQTDGVIKYSYIKKL